MTQQIVLRSTHLFLFRLITQVIDRCNLLQTLLVRF